jgi:hypothetical protein
LSSTRTAATILNANGGDDRFSATGNLAALIKLTVDGGAGADTLLGSNGVDLLLGGDANDFVDGQQGNDVALLGAGSDTFQWDPGDGNDTIEGQADRDTMVFNGSNIGENIDVSANGGRVRFFRNVAAVTMDLNDVEVADFNALGGADNVVVNDLSGTDLTAVDTDLAALGGVGDGQPDNVIVNGTNGDDVVVVAGSAGSAQASGLAAVVSVSGATAGSDRLTVNTLAGDDVVDATGRAPRRAGQRHDRRRAWRQRHHPEPGRRHREVIGRGRERLADDERPHRRRQDRARRRRREADASSRPPGRARSWRDLVLSPARS